MTINSQEWIDECESQRQYFGKLGDLIPDKMDAQVELLWSALEAIHKSNDPENKIPPLVTLFFGDDLLLHSSYTVSFFQTSVFTCSTCSNHGYCNNVCNLTLDVLQTTVNPLQPTKATSLAISGIFRLSRNPMYLGMLLILIAVSLASGAVAGLLLLPAFIAYITFFQILPEELAMQELFSDQYADYCKKVRRWI